LIPSELVVDILVNAMIATPSQVSHFLNYNLCASGASCLLKRLLELPD